MSTAGRLTQPGFVCRGWRQGSIASRCRPWMLQACWGTPRLLTPSRRIPPCRQLPRLPPQAPCPWYAAPKGPIFAEQNSLGVSLLLVRHSFHDPLTKAANTDQPKLHRSSLCKATYWSRCYCVGAFFSQSRQHRFKAWLTSDLCCSTTTKDIQSFGPPDASFMAVYAETSVMCSWGGGCMR